MILPGQMRRNLLLVVALGVLALSSVFLPTVVSRSYTVGVFDEEGEWVEDIQVEYEVEVRKGLVGGNWFDGSIDAGDASYILESSRTKIGSTTLRAWLQTKVEDIRGVGYIDAVLVPEDGSDIAGVVWISRDHTEIHGSIYALEEAHGEHAFFGSHTTQTAIRPQKKK